MSPDGDRPPARRPRDDRATARAALEGIGLVVVMSALVVATGLVLAFVVSLVY